MTMTYNNFDYSPNGKDERRKSDVAIVGAPFDLASTRTSGQREAPTAIRFIDVFDDDMTSVINRVDPAQELRVVDTGDAEFSEGDLVGGWRSIYMKVNEVYQNTRCVIVLGGDHSVSAQAAKAISAVEGPLTIFHFDGHGDFWKPKPGVEMDHGTWVRWCIDNGVANRVVQYGVRGWGISKQERTWAEKNDVTMYTANTPRALERLDEELRDTSDPVYLSVDLDVLDPAFAPAVAFPEPGGITSRELLSAIHMVASSGKMVGGDVCELIPQKDITGVSVKAAHRCVAQMLTGLACVEK